LHPNALLKRSIVGGLELDRVPQGFVIVGLDVVDDLVRVDSIAGRLSVVVNILATQASTVMGVDFVVAQGTGKSNPNLVGICQQLATLLVVMPLPR
jgi:hypothetical protein